MSEHKKARSTLSPEEIEERREAIEYAKHSVELEGIIVSDNLLAIADKYINGELTIDEFIEEGQKALGVGLKV